MMCDGLAGSPGESQKEGQEDQGTSKRPGGVFPSDFTLPQLFPGLPVNPSGLLTLVSVMSPFLKPD